MKDKIINLVNSLKKYSDFNECIFTLTINLDNKINEWSKVKFDIDKIIEEINKVDSIKSFNLTLRTEHKLDKLLSEMDWKGYWFSQSIIFHGDSDIEIQFRFLSNKLSCQQLDNSVIYDGDNSIEKILNLSKVWRDSSKLIYKTHKNLND